MTTNGKVKTTSSFSSITCAVAPLSIVEGNNKALNCEGWFQNCLTVTDQVNQFLSM